jgi:hypothetical protein
MSPATLLVALCMLASQGEADQPDRLTADLEAQVARASDTSLPADERERAGDLAVEIRRRLIDSARPGEPGLAALLVDQAGALLARLGRDGSDSAALFGVITEGQRRQVGAASASASELLRRAGGWPPELRPQAQLLLGRAEALLGAVGTRDRTAHLQLAEETLRPLTLSDPASDAFRRVTLAAVLVLRGGAGHAAAARALAREVLASSDALAHTRVEAFLAACRASPDPVAGVAELSAALKREPFSRAGRPDALPTGLAVNAMSRAMLDRWVATGEQALLPGVFAPQEAFLSGRIESGLDVSQRQAMAFANIAALTELAPLPLERLPPVVSLARGLRLASERSTRDEAARLLQAAAEHPDAGELRPTALWEWGVLLSRSGSHAAQTAAVLTRYAREYADRPDPVRALEALEAALAHARSLVRASEPNAADARRLLLDALGVATTRFVRDSRADDWRLERAQVLSESAEDTPAALDELARIGPRSPRAGQALALFDRVASARLDVALAEVSRARARLDEDGVRRAAADGLPVAQRAAEFFAAGSSTRGDRFRADLADLLVECGRLDEAVPVARDLLRRGAMVPGGRPRVQLALGRGLLGSDALAGFAQLRELADGLEGAAGRPPEFWHAWTLLLELLTARDGDGSRRGEIRVHLRRLESTDPSLGGAPWSARLSRVRDAVR